MKKFTPKLYAETIAALGLTQVGAAEFLKVGERTSRRWIEGKCRIPHAVALLLNLMIDKNIKPQDLQNPEGK
jgi:plasmid maintenance system antidote protein VapI